VFRAAKLVNSYRFHIASPVTLLMKVSPAAQPGDKLREPQATVSFIALLGGSHRDAQQSRTLLPRQPGSGAPIRANKS
jgi:hypothetical protein